MNTCEKCGSPVPEEKAFCPDCGASMTPERERTTETAEGMGETMYEYQPPSKIIEAPMMPAKPVEAETVKAEPRSEPSASKSSARSLAVSGVDYPKIAITKQPVETRQKPTAKDNRTLHLILGASAVLFALSILVFAILYVMGKI